MEKQSKTATVPFPQNNPVGGLLGALLGRESAVARVGDYVPNAIGRSVERLARQLWPLPSDVAVATRYPERARQIRDDMLSINSNTKAGVPQPMGGGDDYAAGDELKNYVTGLKRVMVANKANAAGDLAAKGASASLLTLPFAIMANWKKLRPIKTRKQLEEEKESAIEALSKNLLPDDSEKMEKQSKDKSGPALSEDALAQVADADRSYSSWWWDALRGARERVTGIPSTEAADFPKSKSDNWWWLAGVPAAALAGSYGTYKLVDFLADTRRKNMMLARRKRLESEYKSLLSDSSEAGPVPVVKAAMHRHARAYAGFTKKAVEEVTPSYIWDNLEGKAKAAVIAYTVLTGALSGHFGYQYGKKMNSSVAKEKAIKRVLGRLRADTTPPTLLYPTRNSSFFGGVSTPIGYMSPVTRATMPIGPRPEDEEYPDDKKNKQPFPLSI